jgi:hypothetical protein
MPRTYNGPEHESLRAVARCLLVNFGAHGMGWVDDMLTYMGVRKAEDLSPNGANFVRKCLERRLPLRGDYC